MNQSDLQRIQKILLNGERLCNYLRQHGIKPEQIQQDYAIQWLVTTPLYNIGEHVSRLSPELKQNHSNIPWARISGLRHRLVHNYDGTNWDIIVQCIYEDLPVFLSQLKEEVLPALDEADHTGSNV